MGNGAMLMRSMGKQQSGITADWFGRNVAARNRCVGR